MKSRIMWSEAQHQSFIKLCEMGEVFFGVDWPKSSIKPRLDPLIVGPTGVGKSHLVRSVAEMLKVPLLRLSYGEWMVYGGRGKPTLATVQEFVASYPKGIIHLDEVDKARAGFSSDWSIYAYTELFFLLDRSINQPARNVPWSDASNTKLKECFWIIGSGTWQVLWDKVKTPTIGFGAQEESPNELCMEISKLVRQKEIIPKELLKRFCNELIVIPPPNGTDFELAADIFGIGKLAKELGVKLDYLEAVQSESGARWLEETYGALLMQAYRMGRSDLLDLRPEPEASDSPFTEEGEWEPEVITE